MNAGVYVWQTGYTHGNICLYINVRNDYCFRRRVSRNDMLRHLEISVVFLELQCAVVRCSVSQCVAACCSVLQCFPRVASSRDQCGSMCMAVRAHV